MIDAAISMALEAHRDQKRKGTDLPYVTHPLAVGMILAKTGCADAVIAAGILHDTVEDTPVTLDEIRGSFGERVASIVSGASEPDKSLPWEDRKGHTVDYLKSASLEVRLVTCADKLHNIRTMASEFQKVGDTLWERFRRGREDQAWYYRALVDSLCKRDDNGKYAPLFEQLRDEVVAFFGEKELRWRDPDF